MVRRTVSKTSKQNVLYGITLHSKWAFPPLLHPTLSLMTMKTAGIAICHYFPFKQIISKDSDRWTLEYLLIFHLNITREPFRPSTTRTDPTTYNVLSAFSAIQLAPFPISPQRVMIVLQQTSWVFFLGWK